MNKRWDLFLAVALAASSSASAQRDDKAIELLEKSIAAHQPSGSSLRATLTFEGQGPNPTQALNSLGPYELFPTRRTLAVDERAGKVDVDEVAAIAGLDLHRRLVSTPTESFIQDSLMNRYQAAPIPPNPIHTLLPHARLKAIRSDAQILRALPPGAGGEQRLAFTLPSGASGTLVFDKSTYLLTAVEGAPAQRIYGGETLNILYPGYNRLAGTAIPQGYVLRTTNSVTGTQEIRSRLISAQEAIDANAFVRPASVAAADFSWRKPAFAVETLAPDVHLISNVTGAQDQWSYNVLAVEFDDFVVVAEAPISAEVSEKVLAKVGELAPGKPVRFLVLSHHHGDHIGGIEPYVKRGITTLTTGETAKLLRRIAEVRGASFGTPKLEEVGNRRVIADDRNELHIYDMGHSPHSRQMLVVHLPRQGILYQVDFVNEGEYPRNANTEAFVNWMRSRNLNVKTIAGLHGRTVEAAQLNLAAASR